MHQNRHKNDKGNVARIKKFHSPLSRFLSEPGRNGHAARLEAEPNQRITCNGDDANRHKIHGVNVDHLEDFSLLKAIIRLF